MAQIGMQDRNGLLNPTASFLLVIIAFHPSTYLYCLRQFKTARCILQRRAGMATDTLHPLTPMVGICWARKLTHTTTPLHRLRFIRCWHRAGMATNLLRPPTPMLKTPSHRVRIRTPLHRLWVGATSLGRTVRYRAGMAANLQAPRGQI